MIELETVLILGAGASWDYGFPTGSELVSKICTNLMDSDGPQYGLMEKLSWDTDRTREELVSGSRGVAGAGGSRGLSP